MGYDYCFNTVNGKLELDSVILDYAQTNPGNGDNVFRSGCTEAGWRNWVTRCNSCGKVPPEDTPADDKNLIRYNKCRERYEFDKKSRSSYSGPREERPEVKLDPFDIDSFGEVYCPSAVGGNVQKVGGEFYNKGLDKPFCEGTNQDDNPCSIEQLVDAVNYYKGDVAFEELEYSIFTSLAGICIIFAIIATGTVIAGYFQVMMYTKGMSLFNLY